MNQFIVSLRPGIYNWDGVQFGIFNFDNFVAIVLSTAKDKDVKINSSRS